MPCVTGRAKHVLCNSGCNTNGCSCSMHNPSSYSCRPYFCGDNDVNSLKGVTGSTNWTHLLFFRNQEGIGNNLLNPAFGASDTNLITLAPLAYADGISTPSNRTPNPRIISNAVSSFTGIDDHPTLSTFITWWGQYIDHTLAITPDGTEDLSFTTASNSSEDPNEIYFNSTIHFLRAKFDPESNPREHVTELTSFLDADNVYGKDGKRELALREFDGTGHLKTSAGNLPPFNTSGLENANNTGLPPEDLFLVGDVRGNENIALSAMHIMFMRLHNILADEFAEELPKYIGHDEILYQHARRKIGGIQQWITFNEYLPKVLGVYTPSAYLGYNENVNPSVLKEFSTVAYRGTGHPSVQSVINIGDGSTGVNLVDAFFNPYYIVNNGIDGIVQGALGQHMKNISTEVVDELRNMLFGPPSGGMLLDLVSINIQRGRDLGLPDYNTLRLAYGLSPKATWEDVTNDVVLQGRLSMVYTTPSDADPIIGGLAEPKVSGGLVGELFARIIREQFTRIRDGDRFWFENDPAFRTVDIDEIKSYTLAKVIEKTTNITVSSSSAFVVQV